MRIKLLFLVVLATLVVSCGGDVAKKNRVYVSIPPLAYLVEQIADTTLEVGVLVPETTSPETYEPTARQLAELSSAKVYFAIGLIDFEKVLKDKVADFGVDYVDLSDGLEIVEGACEHSHGEGEHVHGADPHVWLSPKMMKQMAVKVSEVLSNNFPENKELYATRLGAITAKLDALDSTLMRQFSSCGNRNIAIVHPSLTYFARDYGLTQIAIEDDDKEPSAGVVSGLIDKIKASNIKTILYSKQSPAATAQAIADQVGVTLTEYDPLTRDWERGMKNLSMMICN